MCEYIKFIKKYIQELKLTDIVWLWSDIPESELKKCKMILNNDDYRTYRERGLDKNFYKKFLLVKKEDTYELVQCIYNNKTQDLGDFYKIIDLLKIRGNIYHNIKLKSNIIKKKNVLIIHKKYYSNINKLIKYTNLISTPYYYQIEAYETLKNCNRSILKLPCGMGKTLISMLCGLDYKQVIIISPLRQYCKQNLTRFSTEIKYLEYMKLLIDSDGSRNVKYIKKFIKMYPKIILSITYKSVDIFNLIKKYLTNFIIIIDEFHNLTRHDIIECTDTNNKLLQTEFNKLLYSDVEKTKILFMSATPRIFDMYDNGLLNNKIFGDTTYSFEMSKAIENKYICDYKIYLPYMNNVTFNENNIENNIDKEINEQILNIDEIREIYNINLDIAKCKFLMNGCLELGAKKCIIYLRTHIEAQTYKYILEKLKNIYHVPIYVETLLSIDNYKSRNTKLDNFSKFYGYSFLCSVQILDECIDILSCDSIFITYPSNSKIRNIQRLCRANRKDPENIHKEAKIFLWAEENNDIVDILRHLKEYDMTFTFEKVELFNNKKEIIKKNTREYYNIKNFIESVKKITEYDKIWCETLIKIKKNIKQNIKLNNNLYKWLDMQYNLFLEKDYINNNRYLFNLFYDFKMKNPLLFLSNKEKWDFNLNNVREFIVFHKKRPPPDNENYKWLKTNIYFFENKLKIMTKEYYYNKFKEFKETYYDTLSTNNDIWFSNLESLIIFIELNQALPSKNDVLNNSLFLWLEKQLICFDNKSGLMKNQDIYDKFSIFFNTYYKNYKRQIIHIESNKKKFFY